MSDKSGVREVLEALGSTSAGIVNDNDAVALLAIHLGRVQACNDSQDLDELIGVRDGAQRALKITFNVRTTSVLVRSHADMLVNAIAPLERLVDNMQRVKNSTADRKPKTETMSKVEAPEQVKPKLKVAYPVPDTKLQRDIPVAWDSSQIVTEDLFHEMLDVHSELFDGALATSLKGVSIAVLDKLAIGTAYVKAQVWDEAENGPFQPDKKSEHKEMALAMAPAMVTIIPSKDPKRTVYVNSDEFNHRNNGGDGVQPNYDRVNAVMLHESHHASSHGFVNVNYFPGDQRSSWTFDECVTEYFTKKVWDSKYKDRADDYAKYTNYYKGKVWLGKVGAQIASAVGEKLLATAYFTGQPEALNELAKHNEVISRLVNTVKQ